MTTIGDMHASVHDESIITQRIPAARHGSLRGRLLITSRRRHCRHRAAGVQPPLRPGFAQRRDRRSKGTRSLPDVRSRSTIISWPDRKTVTQSARSVPDTIRLDLSRRWLKKVWNFQEYTVVVFDFFRRGGVDPGRTSSVRQSKFRIEGIPAGDGAIVLKAMNDAPRRHSLH